MKVSFANIDLHERPNLILKNAGGTPLGVLGYATNITADIKYNEVSTIEFTVPKYVDGAEVPFYDQLKGMRVIELEPIGQFTLVSPEGTNDGIKAEKKCKAYSLEYEFSYKKITLASDTYKFWDPDTTRREATVLGMIMELMPSWNVIHVDDALINRYRTFEISNENLYNFIKGTLQESYECIFDFDTYNRTVTVRDIAAMVSEEPVFLSTDNLIEEIKISENAEDIVTRLDVNGADGVDIRDVNPTGTNRIINLDYFMDTSNFSQALIDRYNEWKQLCANRRATYYANSIRLNVLIMQRATEEAKLTDLRGELQGIDNQRGAIIQAIAQGIADESALDEINEQYDAKNTEIAAQEADIATITGYIDAARTTLSDIVAECSFTGYFTTTEQLELDRYIKDGEITESSFVSVSSGTYSDDGTSEDAEHRNFTYTDGSFEIVRSGGDTMYDMRGGTLTIGSGLAAEVISGIISVGARGMTATISLSHGTISGKEFSSGNISITGDIDEDDDIPMFVYDRAHTSIAMTFSGYMYFTLNPGEYQRRSVAWDLYEYGENMLDRLSQPTYTFSISSANFMALDEFEQFKNALELGQKVYIDDGHEVLKPICIGVSISYDDIANLKLEFSDSYVSSDTTFRLVNLLDQSVSMGKTVSAGKFNYESFVDSGASTDLKEFIKSALDVAKNAILSSGEQAISWDDAGLRLRKWANEAKTAYEDKQIWMNNNSILMTEDAWQTAKMAIGEFCDPNLATEDNPTGTCWGILAPMIVGTMIAGTSLVIECPNPNGGTALFKVDAGGCQMFNGDIGVVSDSTTLWAYDIISGPINMLDEPSTGDIIAVLEAGTDIVISMKETYGGVSWGYGLSSEGITGWINLDSDGIRMTGETTQNNHVVLSPDFGFVIGKYPVFIEGEHGTRTLNDENAMLWIDSTGSIHMKGVLEGVSGRFSGEVNATTLHIGGVSADEYVSKQVDLKVTDDRIISTVTNSTQYQADISGLQDSIGEMETSIEQNAEAIEARITKDELSAYIRYSNGLLELGQNNTKYTARVSADNGFEVYYNGAQMSYMAKNTTHSPVLTAGRLIQMGENNIKISADGGMIFV